MSKMTNLIQELLVPSETLNQDLKDIDILYTFKCILSENSDKESIKFKDYINQDQHANSNQEPLVFPKAQFRT